MAKTFDKKLEILLLKDYLERKTDENHPASVPDMQRMLEEEHEIISERRTIYRDLKVLRDDYGLDIVENGNKHHVASRDFELEEIKMLVDMVQSSNFLTAKKTEQLLKKLEGQVSVHEAKGLERRIFIRNRVKTKNESVYINIDRISEAISSNRKITFKYYHYNTAKKKELSHGGNPYLISPFALIWVDQNYYMIAYDSDEVKMRHFRVDRMSGISVTDEEREGHKLFARTDMSTYTKKVFYMFPGEEIAVTLRCRNYVADAIIDRFGEDTMIIPDDDGYFTVTETVSVSRQFFAWISAFGPDIEIKKPDSVRKKCQDHLNNILNLYKDDE